MKTMGSEWETSVEEDFSEEFKKYSNHYSGDPKYWGNTTGWGESTFEALLLDKYSLPEDKLQIEIASTEVQDFIKSRLIRYR
jgi:hypothetical protein